MERFYLVQDIMAFCHERYEEFFCSILFSMARQPLVGQSLIIIDAPRSPSDTLHSAGLLWTGDQPDAETSTWQHTTFKSDRHLCPRRHSNPHSQQASDRRPMPWTPRPPWSAAVNFRGWNIFWSFSFQGNRLLERRSGELKMCENIY